MMRYSCVAAALAAIGTLGAASNALAADCNFAGQNVVYVTGSSASSPYLQNLSPLLAAQSKPVTLVYIQTESCQGVTDFTTSTALTSSATYWTASTTDGGAPASNTCNFSATSSPAVSTLADVGVSDVYSATCGVTLTSSQQEYEGPTQAMTFIVNPSSTETSISEEAAHVVFKDIGLTSPTYQVSPWTDPGQLFIRQGGAAGSGTRAMIRAALGFVDSDWSSAIPAANIFTSSGSLLGAVAADTANANASLGILSVTKADGARPGSSATQQVKVLAFQAKGQTCGYLPDSTASSFDKRNVREGRYDIWGPLHFVTAVSSGKPVSTSNPGATGDAAVQALVDLVSLADSLTDAEKMSVIAAAAKAHVVAECAMRVQRTSEVGPEASFVPTGSCGCYWESVATGTKPASCTACSASSDCSSLTASPTCRYGFCEAN